MAEYVYRALDNPQDLRLLVLHPAPNFDDPVVVSLEHHKRFSSKYDISQLEQLHDNYWDAHRGFVDAELNWQAAHAKYVSDCEELGIASAVLQANAQGHYRRMRSSYTAARAKLKTLKKEYDKHDWNDIIEEHNTLFINVPSYEAVSYAWGTEEATELINVEENLSSRKILLVRRTVVDMLQHLRSDAKRNLWIDALCINQSDVSEKETQVQLMGDTYSQAQRVLIWIGSRRGGHSQLAELGLNYSQPTEVGLNRESLKLLINQPWFSRRWVIQEVARSCTAIVVWGDETMDFEKFVQYAFQCATTTVLTAMETEALVRLASIVLCRGTASALNNQRPLVQLLVDFHAAQCSDDRDRLYALKGLSSSSIVVDYEQPADIVYRGFAAAEVLLHPGLVLACAGAFRGKLEVVDIEGELESVWDSDKPTWVPDWRKSPSYIPFSLTEDAPSDGSYIHDGFLLECTAFRRATVLNVLAIRTSAGIPDPGQTCAPPLNTISVSRSKTKGFRAFFRHRRTPAPKDPHLKTLPGVIRSKRQGYWTFFRHRWTPAPEDYTIFIYALTAGVQSTAYKTGEVISHSPYGVEAELTESEVPHLWHWSVVAPPYPPSGGKSRAEFEVAPLALSNYEEDITRTMTGRTCFFTAAGDFGIGPESIRPGDEIVTMAGGSSDSLPYGKQETLSLG